MIKTSRIHTSRGIPSTHPKHSGIEPAAHSRTETEFPRVYLRPVLVLLLLLIVLGGSASVASAQLNIPVVRGDNGLKSGSQPPPGIYLTGLVYFYDTHEIVDANGNSFDRVSIEQGLPAVALTYVSKKK